MPKLIIIALFSCFAGCASTNRTRTYVGPGPDPACGGTELRVTEKKGEVVSMEQVYYASNRTVVETFTPLENGVWQTTLMLYSSRWQNDEPLNAERLVRTKTFRTDHADPVETELKQEFGYEEIDWKNEPKRLLDYYQSNRDDFEPEKSSEDASE